MYPALEAERIADKQENRCLWATRRVVCLVHVLRTESVRGMISKSP